MGAAGMVGRRRFLLPSAGAALAVACSGARVALPTPRRGASADELDEISREILSGGPPPDGIPPVEKPAYLSIADASKQ